MKSVRQDTALILLTLGCVAVYLILVTYQRDDLQGQVRLERRRREDAEHIAHLKVEQLDGALAKIHELRTDESDA